MSVDETAVATAVAWADSSAMRRVGLTAVRWAVPWAVCWAESKADAMAAKWVEHLVE